MTSFTVTIRENQELIGDTKIKYESDGPRLLAFTGTEDAFGDAVETLASSALAMVKSYPDPITPDVVQTATKFFVSSVNAGLALEEPEWMLGALSGLDKDAFAECLLQIIGTFGDADEGTLNAQGKAAAIAAAEVLGPDWAQVLYRFTILVTKLA